MTIVESGSTANRLTACTFGDIVGSACYTSESSVECIALIVFAHSVVDVTLTIDGDGSDWASPSQSHTYGYVLILQIYEMSQSILPMDVPYAVNIKRKSFGYPSELMCKLGSAISSKAIILDGNSSEFFIPPIH